jgi:glycosyltransferase involved in cell wall biosynthesis
MVIVIPCYKEARRIDVDEFVRVSEFFQTAVFVDDGSSDETFERLSLVKRRMTASGGHALVERLPQNVGKGEAVRLGIRRCLAARGTPKAPAVADADLSAPFGEMCRLAGLLLARGCDVVQGSRVRLMGKDIVRSPIRHYVCRVSATLISQMLDLPIYDTQAGAKVFSARAVEGPLFQQPFLSRWLFDCEIFLRVRQLGLNIIEEPLERWHAQPVDSKVNIFSYLRSLHDLLRIRGHYLG